MGKTDVVVRTAQDLERKYNFASLLGLKKNVEITTQGMQKIENELNNMLNALVINLKDVLDSQSEISLWFYSGMPTTKNEPYVSWGNPDEHIGDIYYDQSTGKVYQWNGLWEVNTYPDLIEAMAITNAEIDTTEDHERKVFFDTPTVPYSNGDWWIKEDGRLFICQISKKEGVFEEVDFINCNAYTESIAEKVAEELKVLKGTVTTISENYAKFTDLATGGSTTIAGENITTGSIQSQNYIENISGTKLNLTDGTIDAKSFKVNETGDIEAKSGEIGGFKLGEDKFYSQITVDHDFTTDDVAIVQKKINDEKTRIFTVYDSLNNSMSFYVPDYYGYKYGLMINRISTLNGNEVSTWLYVISNLPLAYSSDLQCLINNYGSYGKFDYRLAGYYGTDTTIDAFVSTDGHWNLLDLKPEEIKWTNYDFIEAANQEGVYLPTGTILHSSDYSKEFAEADIKKYDLDEDGVITLKDLDLIEKLALVNEYITTEKPASFEFNSDNPTKTFLIKDYNGVERICISFLGLKISLSDDNVFEVNKNGVFINGNQITGSNE